MKPDQLLDASLLDIVFENRNKAYGAYNLRSRYAERLGVALLCTLGVVFLLSLEFLSREGASSRFTGQVFLPSHTHVLTLRKFGPLPARPSEAMHPVHSVRSEEMPPRIVDSVNINKPVAAPEDTLASSPAGEGSGSPAAGMPGTGNGPGPSDTAASRRVGPDPLTPVEEAPVMPQFPGGTAALLEYLRRHLVAPEELDPGSTVSVKVRFVVSYDGTLRSFDVLQSGGAAFDQEVIRVLKKMPLWIPGKNGQENVSVYYIVPVKFTADD